MIPYQILTISLPSSLIFLYLSFPIRKPPFFSFPHLDHLYSTIYISAFPPSLPPPIIFPFTLLTSAVTQGYIIKSEDLELWTIDEREHTIFVFLCLHYLTQYIFSSSIYLPVNFILLYSRTIFQNSYKPYFHYLFIKWKAFRLFLLTTHCK